ncbi:hypothetical protein CEXT_38881 [Caerostris extrusa]|uniref:Uncharacterized protein n=1 Tax=Caerostris extrusa TaxID=172846 RepID=A0AAV4P0Z2_CAEEX|nr:hypothetical protein CEXT_38881 [Caerostris extrusa]
MELQIEKPTNALNIAIRQQEHESKYQEMDLGCQGWRFRQHDRCLRNNKKPIRTLGVHYKSAGIPSPSLAAMWKEKKLVVEFQTFGTRFQTDHRVLRRLIGFLA